MIDLVYVLGTGLPRSVAPWYPDLLWRLPEASKRAFITFDDGPTPQLTAALLDILARFDAGASFFVLGKHAERDPGLVRAIAEAGHAVGNHSYSHKDPWRLTRADLHDELERTTGLLEDLTGQPVRWMRPPYGHFTRPMRRWCRHHGQRLTMWDLGVGDFLASASPPGVEARILKHIRPGSIIVLHDNPKTRRVTPPALSNVLARLRDDGWQFGALETTGLG